MEESVAFDADTYVLVQRFIKWVDSLLEIEDEESDIGQKSVNLPSYAKSKAQSRTMPYYNTREKVLNGITSCKHIEVTDLKFDSLNYELESTNDIDKKGLRQSVVERIKLLNKAQNIMKFQDESNPYTANNIYKCKAIEKSITAPLGKSTNKGDNHLNEDITKKKGVSISERKTKIINDYSKENETKKSTITDIEEGTVPENIYRNKELWSDRSVELEELLKPHILKGNLKATWEQHRLLFDFNLYSSLLDDLEVGIVDTYFVNISDDFTRTWTRSSKDRNVYRMMTNSTFSASDIPSPRLSVSRIYSDFFYFGGKFVLRNENCSYRDIDHSIYSMVDKRLSNNVDSAELLTCFGTLKGITAAGNVHVRPLCSVGDVLIALHELLDPDDFLCGCVQLPILMSAHLIRHTCGYYRFIYSRTQPPIWQYQCISDHVPEVLAPFLCPVLSNAQNAFTIELLDSKNIDPILRSSAAKVISSINRKFCHERVLSGITVDFEMSSGRRSQDIESMSQFYRIINISSAIFSDRIIAPRRLAISGLHFNSLDYLNAFYNAFQNQWKQRHQLSTNDDYLDSLLYDHSPLPISQELTNHQQKPGTSENDFARSGYTPPFTSSKRTKDYLVENVSSHATDLIRKLLFQSQDGSSTCSDSDGSGCKTTVDEGRHGHNDEKLRIQSNMIALHVFSFLYSEDFVEIVVSHLDELVEPDVDFNSECSDINIQPEANNYISLGDSVKETVVPDNYDIEVDLVEAHSPTIVDVVNAVDKIVGDDSSCKDKETVYPTMKSISDLSASPSSLQQHVVDALRPTQKLFNHGDHLISEQVKASIMGENLHLLPRKVIREMKAVKYLVKHVDSYSYDTNFESPSIGEALSKNVQMEANISPAVQVDNIPLNPNDKLSAIAYDIAKELSAEELMGHFSINKYFKEDLMKTEVKKSDSDEYVDKKAPEQLFTEYNSNDTFAADSGQIIAGGDTDMLFEEHSNTTTSSKSRTRTWNRRNRGDKSRDQSGKSRRLSSKSKKVQREGKIDAKMERDAAFLLECERIMSLLLDGINPLLAEKIRRGLNNFTTTESPLKKKKRRKRKSSSTRIDNNIGLIESSIDKVEESNIFIENDDAKYFQDHNFSSTIFSFVRQYDSTKYYSMDQDPSANSTNDMMIHFVNHPNSVEVECQSIGGPSEVSSLRDEIRCQPGDYFNDDHLSLGSAYSNDTILDLKVINVFNESSNGNVTSMPPTPPRPPVPSIYKNASSSVNDTKITSEKKSMPKNKSQKESKSALNDSFYDESEKSSNSNSSYENQECGSDFIYEDDTSSDENGEFESILRENQLLDKANDAMLLMTSTRRTIRENISRESKRNTSSAKQVPFLVFEILLELESKDSIKKQSKDMTVISKSLIKKEKNISIKKRDVNKQPLFRPSLSVSAIDSIKIQSWNNSSGLETSSESRNPFNKATYVARVPMRAKSTVRQATSNYVGGGIVDSNGYYLAKRSLTDSRRMVGRVHIPTGSKTVSLHGKSNNNHSIHLSESSSSESERENIGGRWIVSDHCVTGQAILRQAESLLRSHEYHKEPRLSINSEGSQEYDLHFHPQKTRVIDPVDRKFLTAMSVALKTILFDGNMLNKDDNNTKSTIDRRDHCIDRHIKTPKLVPPPLRSGSLWNGDMLWEPHNSKLSLHELNLTMGDCKTIEGMSYDKEEENHFINDSDSQTLLFSSLLHNSMETDMLQSTVSTTIESESVYASEIDKTQSRRKMKMVDKNAYPKSNTTTSAKVDKSKPPKGLYIIAQSYKKNISEPKPSKKGKNGPLKLPILNKRYTTVLNAEINGRNSVTLQNFHHPSGVFDDSRPPSAGTVFTDSISLSGSQLDIFDVTVFCGEIVESVLLSVLCSIGKNTIVIVDDHDTIIASNLSVPQIEHVIIPTVQNITDNGLDDLINNTVKTPEVFIHLRENNRIPRSRPSGLAFSLRQLGDPDWHFTQSDSIVVDGDEFIDIDHISPPVLGKDTNCNNNNYKISSVLAPSLTTLSPLAEFQQQSKATTTPRQPREKPSRSLVRPSAVKPEPPMATCKSISPQKASTHRKLTCVQLDLNS